GDALIQVGDAKVVIKRCGERLHEVGAEHTDVRAIRSQELSPEWQASAPRAHVENASVWHYALEEVEAGMHAPVPLDQLVLPHVSERCRARRCFETRDVERRPRFGVDRLGPPA